MTSQEWAAKKGREYNEVWKESTALFKDKVEKCLVEAEDDNFKLEYVAKVIEDETGSPLPNEYYPYERYVILLTAGKNGDGEWTDYFIDAHNIFVNLTDPDVGGFEKAYLIDWENDPSDDVSYLYIGVR
jgi:hypothetical protein